MNVAGPSRGPPAGRFAPRGRVESAYEEDLLGLLGQLSINDMDEIQTFFTHRIRAGDALSDQDVAMNDLLQQARALAAFDQDRALAQRIAAGEDVGRDQTPAHRPGPVPRPNGNGTATQQNVNQRPAARPARNDAVPSQSWGGWFSSVLDWAFSAQPVAQPAGGPTNPSSTAPKPPTVNRPTGHDCVICQEPIYGAEIRAPCGHYYGIDCITDLFQSATRDESLFPPRCCRQNIPFTQVRPHISQALVTTFQQKQAEFGTLKRVYCSSPTCSRFLGPVSEGLFTTKVYTCPAPGCQRRTCGKCREQYSGDWTHTCRPDADATQVLELSRASGWARCPGCSQMIELNIGCFHMTCRCRTEFCYLCRARWKTCRCPQWDEGRLLAAAEARVDAQLGAGQVRGGARRDAPAQRAAPVPVLNPVPVAANRAQALDARPAPIPILVNRTQADAMAARPAPPPVPARRPVPAEEVLYPQRTPTASSSTTRPANTTSASSGAGNHKTKSWASLVAATNTGSSAFASTSRSGIASTPTPTPASSARPKLVSTPNADPMRQRLVREMMERLREDHECDHTGWRYRHGGGVCQSCGHRLPLYLFRCQGCEMLACNRCRRNRL